MTLEEKFKIVRSVGEECVQEDELWNLLDKKPQPVCYDGFEPSGRMHIAQVCLTKPICTGLNLCKQHFRLGEFIPFRPFHCFITFFFFI